MEVIKKRGVVKHRDKIKPLDDPAQAGESTLSLTISDRESIVIDGKMRIHMAAITGTGVNGGAQAARLVFIGPRDMTIERVPRPGNKGV